MKALCISVLIFLVSTAALGADSPFDSVAQVLPEQHSHANSSVAAMTLEELERIALQANPEIRLAVRHHSLPPEGSRGGIDPKPPDHAVCSVEKISLELAR